MARSTRHLVGLALVAGLVAGALVASGLVLLADDDSQVSARSQAGARPEATASPPATDAYWTVTEPAAPDEPVDAPRAWTAQDPSIETPPAEVVEEAAPDATEDTLLRVVSVVNRDGQPAIVVERTRGPGAATEAVGRAQRSDDVVAVSVDTRVTLDSPDTMPAVPLADALRSNQWALDRLGAERAWSDYSSGEGSVVAVVDTGVDSGHPDLVGQLTRAGIDYVTAGGDGRTDPHGHGTHVAGIVAAVRGNGLGVAGLAPSAKVMPVRVLDQSGTGWTSNIAKGVIYAADNGADVINLSLGSPAEDSATKVAVNYAMSQGAVVVAAAGNNRATDNATNYPAAYPGVLAVASTERGDTSSLFSNTGPYVDVAAPGGRIVSTVPGGYGYMSGTSMATPYVAAAAALVVDLTGGTVTTEQFERRLAASAWDLGPPGWDPEFGYGLTNPHQLLCSFSTCGAVLTPTSTPTPTPASPSSPAPPSSAAPAPAPPPAPAPAPAPAPTETITPTASPTPSPSPTPRSTPSPSPTPADEVAPDKRTLRLVFTTSGGTARRGERVLIGLRVTDAETGRAVAGQSVVVRGRRDGEVVLQRGVTTSDTGDATVRVRLRATTRFTLRSAATDSTRAATSVTSLRWRVR